MSFEIRTAALWLLFIGLLVRTGAAQNLQVSGPATGQPGTAMTFALMNGSTVVAADQWQQGLNPDRYTGYDYVSSFTLTFTSNPDNSETIVAPAPGRYKILAYSGGQSYQAYVVIQPTTTAPAIRGFAYGLYGAVDQAKAISELTTAKKAGMNWVSFWFEACMDIDSGNLNVQVLPLPSCSPASESDVEWLIDEAHTLGFQVSYVPYINAVYMGVTNELETFLNPFPPPPPFPNIVTVFDAVMQWQIHSAGIAAAHHAEALVMGNNFQAPPSSLDATFNQIWAQTISQIRSIYDGKLWVGWVFPCGASFNFTNWNLVDGIDMAPIIPGSGQFCSSSAGQSNFPTATEMLANFLNTQSLPAFQLQASTGLPMIWLGLPAVNFDGMNYSAPDVVQDNQEDVDYFEATMLAKSQVAGQMAAAIVDGPDIMTQPAYYGAMANWFGGDLAYFSPCWAAAPAGILFQNTFDPGPCPLPVGGSAPGVLSPIYNPGDVTVIADPSNPSNQILRISPSGLAGMGDGSLWTDYSLSAEFRTANSQAIATFGFRSQSGRGDYELQVSNSSATLFKSGSEVSSQPIPGGLPLNVFNSVVVTVQGGAISAQINSATILTYTDGSPFPSGGAYLTTCCGAASGPYDFDNILVTSLATPVSPVCTYSTSISTLSFAAPGGPGILHAIASDPACAWSSSSGVNWITITSGIHGTGSVPVLFTLAPNATGSTRNANMLVAGQTVTVQQAPCGNYTVAPASVTLAGGATNGTFAITAPSCSWSITGNPSWLTVTPSGSGNSTVGYSAAANVTGQIRTATLSIMPPGGGSSSTFTLTQFPQIGFTTVIVHPGDPGWSVFSYNGGMAGITADNPRGGSGSLRLSITPGQSAEYSYTSNAPLGTWGALTALSTDYYIAAGAGQPPTIVLRVYPFGDSRTFFAAIDACHPGVCTSNAPVGSWQTRNAFNEAFQFYSAEGNPVPASLAAIPPNAPIYSVQLWNPYANGQAWTAYADNLTVAFAGAGVIFNFEPLACKIGGAGTVGVSDIQAVVNQALGVMPPVSDLNSDGVVNVIDVQIVMNAALGLGCIG